MTSVPPPPPNGTLDNDDIAWARELAATMITAALAVANSDDAEAEPVYAAARSQALSVRTDDGMGADRWLAAMFFISAHAAGLLRQLGRHDNIEPAAVWQNVLLRRYEKPSS
ncbi:MAG: hypothetical protein IT196_08470 [Acidimicrobiales bacterium]|nr:hypothetical protein [Acidimicrobiales bacterium]